VGRVDYVHLHAGAAERMFIAPSSTLTESSCETTTATRLSVPVYIGSQPYRRAGIGEFHLRPVTPPESTRACWNREWAEDPD